MKLVEACELVGISQKTMESYEGGVPLLKSKAPLAEGVNRFSGISFTTKRGLSVVMTTLEINVGWDPTRFNQELIVRTSTEAGHFRATYKTYGHRAGTDQQNSGNWSDIYTLSYSPSNDIPDDDQHLLVARRQRAFVAPYGGVEYVNGGSGRLIRYELPPSV